MDCEQTHTVLHGYLDSELDAVRAAEFERHLENCAECVAALELQESFRSTIKRAKLYAEVPDGVRRRVLDVIHPVPAVPIVRDRTSWRWLAAAASILLLAYAAWRVLPALRSADTESIVAAQSIDAHLRSLQPGHLADVVSTDQHTVKPWFSGKLDFSPPVRDFADQDFPLQGGRLDVIQARTVAALVYGRRKHLVNVFIWPADVRDIAAESGSQKGYQWVHWRKAGMEFCAVSDVAKTDLEQLQQLLAQ